MSDRCILSVRFTAVSASGGLRRAVAGFLRYVQYRDHHVDVEREETTEIEVSGLLKYVAYRDRAASHGRLFGPDGTAGDLERKQLAAYVMRSVRDLDVGRTGRPQRAVYRMVISPERAEGLDLRQLTRATMAELERRSGPGGLPPWVAAEHRNTAHPHVHVVMAARREVAPGRYRTLVITRERLAHMKLAVNHDLERQRGRPPRESGNWREVAGRRRRQAGQRPQTRHPHELSRALDRALAGMASHYRREAEREAERLRRQLERDDEWSR